MNSTQTNKARRAVALCLTSISFVAIPASALAYVGPGAGLSIIGSVLAFLAAVIVAIFGFLFFPIRRMLRKRKQRAALKAAENSPDASADPAVRGDKQAAASEHNPGA
jgi:hypothetical protein